MRILYSLFLSLLLVPASVFPANSQPTPAAAQPASAQPASAQPGSPAGGADPAAQASAGGSQPAAASLADVIDRVVQREHLFLAQMRHMHPMVETYIQDLKPDSAGNPTPANDHYFLGRLDMTDGPGDVSFTGQPGFGQRMLAKLTGVYSMHFLPLGFAQMVVLDTDFQKRYYNFTFVRR